MILKKIYKKIIRQRKVKAFKKYVDMNYNSFYADDFYVELRHPVKGKIYLKTGEKCVLSGRYIFETEAGNIEIGNRVHIGNSTFISINSIKIDDDVLIAWDCLFYDHNSHAVEWENRKNDVLQEYDDLKIFHDPLKNKNWSVVKSKPIHICSKAWIGYGCKILKGVTIGEGAIVAAGSVVVNDVEPWTVVGGNPARLIKKLR